jgi:hypothetical protein
MDNHTMAEQWQEMQGTLATWRNISNTIDGMVDEQTEIVTEFDALMTLSFIAANCIAVQAQSDSTSSNFRNQLQSLICDLSQEPIHDFDNTQYKQIYETP